MTNMKPKIEIIKMNCVILTDRKTEAQFCGICKTAVEEPCPDCDGNGKNAVCVIAEGKCGHIYHKHCIDRWVAKQQMCPMCHGIWVMKE
ncbi:RING-H2_zinc finger domain-containing protein [Hexamita inflata]|uniref:RING-H2 zinc finger domain-containing protein n=1 Tax=Hexamita inflata TaxID=28002 RepID=A0AA86RSQ4_9EUKA|nr:RING-H2 zinc finger domain-containing protein [Hexamita inflata]CAI9971870.1 RING-H2 zinc finger domain-containing protein [Hexamita inflata]